jgi:S-adenosylmethionine decarboxylase
LSELGTHTILDFYGVEESKLDAEEFIKYVIQEAINACGATLLSMRAHKFHPQGLTIVAILSESHISYHSFPERGQAAAIDIYTCGKIDNQKAVEVFKRELDPGIAFIEVKKRGKDEEAS